MTRASRLLTMALAGMAALALAACAMEGADAARRADGAPHSYALGGARFSFPAGALLQTWPVMFRQPGEFARLAVQMPAAALAPDELAGFTDIVQVDVLQAGLIPDATSILATAFTDWVGREEEPAGSTYKFLVTSNRAETGAKVAYLRQYQKLLDLDSLAPFKPQAGAPIYVFALDGTRVTTLIECGPLWARYEGLDYCSLRRAIDSDHGYRVLFPQDLLVHWRVFDEAARDYVGAARR